MTFVPPDFLIHFGFQRRGKEVDRGREKVTRKVGKRGVQKWVMKVDVS
jgi:hypothetical protein